MKFRCLLFGALAGLLAGCASQPPAVTYHEPLTSPGGEFSRLPPAVQNSVRAEAGSAEITTISQETRGGSTIYVFHFKNTAVFPPLYVASDGTVLTPNFRVAVGATRDSIRASTGRGSNGIKLDDLPPNVVSTIHSQAPTAEIDSIHKFEAGSEVYYDVIFKNPERHPRLLITEDGRVVR